MKPAKRNTKQGTNVAKIFYHVKHWLDQYTTLHKFSNTADSTYADGCGQSGKIVELLEVK